MNILAIDLGSNKSVYGISGELGAKPAYGSVPTTPEAFHDLILQHAPDRVVIEVGAQAGWVHDLCLALEVACVVANTADEMWRWNRTRKKTDKKDVDRMLFLAHSDTLPRVYMPVRDVRQWRQLIRYRHELVNDQTQIKNRVKAILNREGIKLKVAGSSWTQAYLEALGGLSRPLADCEADTFWRGQLHVELERLVQVMGHLKTVTKRLNAYAKEREPVGRLKTIPGVGPRTAEKLAATLDDPDRFTTAKQVGCYLGLTQRVYQSGQMLREGKISKMGDTHLRTLLVEAAWSAIRKDGPMKALFDRVCRGMKNRRKVAIVAVARHLGIIAWAMMRDQTTWQPTAPGSAPAPGSSPGSIPGRYPASGPGQ